MAIIKEPQYLEMCSLVWRYSAHCISRYVKSCEHSDGVKSELMYEKFHVDKILIHCIRM